ncbi:MAG TPA: carboxylate-amine ligase, partial [Promineifilum sp.]|nr:carboxylate-amine ligase [Promineifilum sp.]
FALDFLTVKDEDGAWEPYAIEVNLRKGGTTHPFLTLQYLTDGMYDPESGEFTTELGERRYYVAGDHVESPAYRIFTPDDLLDLISVHRLAFDQTCQIGVVLHMFSGVGELGRLGVTCIHGTPARARALHDDFIALLDREAARRGAG